MKFIYILLFIFWTPHVFAKPSERQQNSKQIALFFNEVAQLESSVAGKKKTPSELDVQLKAVLAREEALREIIKNQSPGLSGRALKAVERAKEKLRTPGAFSNITNEDIQVALNEIPKGPIMPLPPRPGYDLMSRQFFCLRALMENGAERQLTVDGDKVIYKTDPQSLFIKSNYNNEPSTFIYTQEGIYYIRDREAEQQKCIEKFNGDTYITIDMLKGEGVQERTMKISANGSFTEVNSTERKMSAGAAGCEASFTVPGESFSHIPDIAAQMAIKMAEAYSKEVDDLPRQLVLKKNGENITRRNDQNIMNALNACKGAGIVNPSMQIAINKLNEARNPLGQVDSTETEVAP